ncbi:toll/interleukin-1 receptor domain-containing protein [Micromonospora sp. NPDC005215]|uniref:toll/interleukin-1 receptor domain-containing protein n=1 Tax=Micromonospora sp. NPDC005215 TaxID=3157024 RepID=UPI0033A5BD2F
MTGVFINYRTGDGQGMAALLHERLRGEFGEQKVFLDSTGLPPGQLFAPELKRRLQESTVLIVVLGKEWLDIRDDDGNRRIDNRDDYVRYEIRKSIKWKKAVLPVLLDGASMPPAAQLPPDIVKLPVFQYRHLRSREADIDLAEIVRILREHIPLREPSSPGGGTTNTAHAPQGAAAAGDGATATYNHHGSRR